MKNKITLIKIISFNILLAFSGKVVYGETTILEQGERLTAAGQYQEAITGYKKSLEDNSKDWQTWFALGQVYQKADLLNQAKECFQKVIKLKKDYPEVYFSLGEVFFQEGIYSQAIKGYLQSLDLNPKQSEVYFHLAKAYKQSGETNKAIEYLEKLISLEPKKDYYYQLGLLYSRNKLSERALDAFTQTLKLDSQYFPAYLQKAFIYQKRKNFDLAIGEINRTLKINPQSSLSYFLLALIDYEKGDKKQAYLNAEKARSLSQSKFLNRYLEIFLARIK